MFNKRYEVHRHISVHKGFEKEAEFDTREDAQRGIDDEVARWASKGGAGGDVNEMFKIVECNTPTATQSDKQSEKGVNMVNLLNGSAQDRINFIKEAFKSEDDLNAIIKEAKSLINYSVFDDNSERTVNFVKVNKDNVELSIKTVKTICEVAGKTYKYIDSGVAIFEDGKILFEFDLDGCGGEEYAYNVDDSPLISTKTDSFGGVETTILSEDRTTATTTDNKGGVNVSKLDKDGNATSTIGDNSGQIECQCE